MVYLPTLISMVNVGKCIIHGWYGIGFVVESWEDLPFG